MYLLASSLAAALLDDFFEHPASVYTMCELVRRSPLVERKMVASRTDSAGQESQGHAVDAVPKAGGPWPILKHMALVALTSRAMNFRSGHEELGIGSSLNHAWIDRLPEAGPAGTAVELVLG